MFGQSTNKNSKAASNGACSVAHSGNNDTIIIKNCGIGEQQGQKIIDLLKQVLLDKDQGKKLDEVLEFLKRSSNPYASVTTYSFDGHSRTFTPSENRTSMNTAGALQFLDIQKAIRNRDWAEVTMLSEKAIASYPGWFTPYFTLGMAQGYLCQSSAAASLERFIQDTEGAVGFEESQQDARIYLNGLQNVDYKRNCAINGRGDR